jgi:hypothetical protein
MNDLGWSNGRQGSRQRHLIEIIEFFSLLFRRGSTTKQISGATKPFPAFGADIRKQPMVIHSVTKTAGSAGT